MFRSGISRGWIQRHLSFLANLVPKTLISSVGLPHEDLGKLLAHHDQAVIQHTWFSTLTMNRSHPDRHRRSIMQ